MAHESGSFSIDTHAAAIKTATAGVSDSPGRWPARRPPAAPRNNAGNVGPPRKLPSDRLQASPTLGSGSIPFSSSARNEARTARNFGEADRLRAELAAKGVQLEDNPDGTTSWHVKR